MPCVRLRRSIGFRRLSCILFATTSMMLIFILSISVKLIALTPENVLIRDARDILSHREHLEPVIMSKQPLLNDLPRRCDKLEDAPPFLRLKRLQCDRIIPLPPAAQPLNPIFMKIPGARDLLLLIWRVRLSSAKLKPDSEKRENGWPNDIAVALINATSGSLVPHHVPFSAIRPYQHQWNRFYHRDAHERNQTLETFLRGRHTFLVIESPYCLQTKDLRPLWWRNQLYLVSTSMCGKEREMLVPFHIAMARETSTGKVLRWRAWVNFAEPRYFILTPQPDEQPYVAERICFQQSDPDDNASQYYHHYHPFRERLPSQREKNWAVLPVPSTHGDADSSLIFIRHLCPLTALRSTTLNGSDIDVARRSRLHALRGRHTIGTAGVSRLVPLRLVETRPVTALTRSTGTAPPQSVRDCVDWSSSAKHSNDFGDREPLFDYLYPPFGRRPTSDLTPECTIAPAHINATADPLWHLDMPECLRLALYETAWRGGSDMVTVLLPHGANGNGTHATTNESLYLGTAHLKVWQLNRTVAFYWHFFYVLRVVHTPAKNTTVSLLSASRLFRFHQRRSNLPEFSTGVLLVAPNTIMLSYGELGTCAFVATSTIEAMLYNTIRFPAYQPPEEEKANLDSKSLHLSESFDSPIFSRKLTVNNQVKNAPSVIWLS